MNTGSTLELKAGVFMTSSERAEANSQYQKKRWQLTDELEQDPEWSAMSLADKERYLDDVMQDDVPSGTFLEEIREKPTGA